MGKLTIYKWQVSIVFRMFTRGYHVHSWFSFLSNVIVMNCPVIMNVPGQLTFISSQETANDSHPIPRPLRPRKLLQECSCQPRWSHPQTSDPGPNPWDPDPWDGSKRNETIVVVKNRRNFIMEMHGNVIHVQSTHKQNNNEYFPMGKLEKLR